MPTLMVASNALPVSAVMVCASMSSLVTLIVAPGLTVSAPWYWKPLINISAAAAAGEVPWLEVGGAVPVVVAGADDGCAVGADAVPEPGMPAFPQPERANKAIAAASPGVHLVLMFVFMVKPFVEPGCGGVLRR